jgi:hypothetical protein
MPDTLRPPTNADLAERWGCCVRTVQRMRRAGVDTTDAVAVADHVLRLKNPSLAMLVAATRNIAAMPKESAREAFAQGWRDGWKTPTAPKP